MYKTKNDLPENTRAKVIQILNGRLADCIDLMTQSKQAHWNVKGSQFIALHELFDKIAASVTAYVDLIAERIVQLGGIAEGTVRVVGKRSSLSEYPLDISDGPEHVQALSDGLSKFGKEARQAIDQTDELDDVDTADIFTEISRGIDKWLWYVEAHLQSAESRANAVRG